jgi:hypothetical protein
MSIPPDIRQEKALAMIDRGTDRPRSTIHTLEPRARTQVASPNVRGSCLLETISSLFFPVHPLKQTADCPSHEQFAAPCHDPGSCLERGSPDPNEDQESDNRGGINTPPDEVHIAETASP